MGLCHYDKPNICYKSPAFACGRFCFANQAIDVAEDGMLDRIPEAVALELIPPVAPPDVPSETIPPEAFPSDTTPFEADPLLLQPANEKTAKAADMSAIMTLFFNFQPSFLSNLLITDDLISSYPKCYFSHFQ